MGGMYEAQSHYSTIVKDVNPEIILASDQACVVDTSYEKIEIKNTGFNTFEAQQVQTYEAPGYAMYEQGGVQQFNTTGQFQTYDAPSVGYASYEQGGVQQFNTTGQLLANTEV